MVSNLFYFSWTACGGGGEEEGGRIQKLQLPKESPIPYYLIGPSMTTDVIWVIVICCFLVISVLLVCIFHKRCDSGEKENELVKKNKKSNRNIIRVDKSEESNRSNRNITRVEKSKESNGNITRGSNTVIWTGDGGALSSTASRTALASSATGRHHHHHQHLGGGHHYGGGCRCGGGCGCGS